MRKQNPSLTKPNQDREASFFASLLTEIPLGYILWAKKREVSLLNPYEDQEASYFASMLTVTQGDSVSEDARSFTSNAHYIFNCAATINIYIYNIVTEKLNISLPWPQ